ncbi:polysaccharide pyruvyl transferase family protein [Methylocaldum sp. MU1018]
MYLRLALKNIRSQMRESVRVPLLYREWRQERKRLERTPSARQNHDIRSILIAPADVISLTGSKGDEAMIAALVEGVRRHIPDCRFGIFSVDEEDAHSCSEPGVRSEAVWANPWSLRKLTDTVARYDAVALVGGDIMDGYYNAITSLRMWVLADLAARMGKPTVILGFSFNASPSPKLAKCLNALDPAVNICVRDAFSLERFNRFSKATGRLVADSAFLLRPRTDGPEAARVRAWAEQQRAQGKMVCGFNLHPMLVKNGDPTRIGALVDSAVATLSDLGARRPVSFLLIPHDFRGGTLGDGAMLSPIYERVRPVLGDRVIYPSNPLHAAELKALAGSADLTVTGRMHLAVGSLSQGVPVAAITYQDKFQGLFRHFGLPESLMLPPDRTRDPAAFARMVETAIDRRRELAEQVAAKLPEVVRLAEINLSPFLGNAHAG